MLQLREMIGASPYELHERTPTAQETHSEAAARAIGDHLKNTLSGFIFCFFLY